MKQTQFDKHTIAWFKIAECVSRGEKERALGVYRLLSHSFNDNAIARQLEADIYCSFGDIDQAVLLYRQAMELYHKSQRFLEAAAVGEHLVYMRPAELLLYREMLQLYIALGMLPKVRLYLKKLIDFLAQRQQWYEIKNIVIDCAGFSDNFGRTHLYGDAVVAAYQVGCPWDIVEHCIEQALDNLCLADDEKCVQHFISALQLCSDELHNYAMTYVAK